MQMTRIEEERWIVTIVSARRYLEFNVFMRDVFLLKIHSMEAAAALGHKTTRS